MTSQLSIQSSLSDYVYSNCVDLGCRLKIGKEVQNYIIFKIESYWDKCLKKGKICDFMIPCEYNKKNKVVLTEHRNKNCKVSQLEEKYYNAIGEINNILTTDFSDFENTHIILISKSISTPELNELRSIKLNFFSRKGKRIIHIRCNSFLDKILQILEKK
ncbi:MAG: hypothetical protein ACTSQ8_23005 [Candidatus Helarchaeota archaeon]